MNSTALYNLDEETIRKVGLELSDRQINAQVAPDARVLRCPHLEEVYVMESDLYGNTMPKDTCFLVFTGKHGLIGTHLKVDLLKSASVEDIRKIIAANSQG